MKSGLLVVFSASLFAQVGAPNLGFVPDSASLRSMNGIASAGNVGSLLDPGVTLNSIVVSPSQQFALGVAAGDGSILLLPLSDGTFTGVATSLAGVGSAPDRVVFSPNGSAALLWFSSTKQLQLLAGLPSSQAIHSIDASFMGGDPVSLAVSDDGQWAAGAWSTGARAFSADGRVLPINADGPVSALAFFHGKTDVALMTADQVTTIADVGGAAASTLIWSKPAGSSADSPVVAGLAVSGDNGRVTVLGASGGIDTFNLSNDSSMYVDCGCVPSGLAPLGGSLYRLTGVESGSVQIYDAATSDIWLVPLAPQVRARRPVKREITRTGSSQGDQQQ